MSIVSEKKDRHLESLKYSLNILFSEKYHKYIKSIYLYGSCARCSQTYNSDVDLYVRVLKDTPNNLKREMICDVTPDDSTLPEVNICFGTDENIFSSIPQFNSNLKKEAKLLWEK